MVLTDRVVWITGASAGIGRAMALAFAEAGADVAVSARRADRLTEVVAGIAARGRRGLAIPCDVTDEQAIEATVEQVVEHFGRLDVAVANAGFVVRGRIEALDADAWRRQLDVNLIGLALTARHAIPALRRTRGRLALVGSVAGLLPAAGSGAYAASKAAVESVGRTLSVELHGTGVSCTTILPGFVESEIGRVDSQGVFHADREERRPARLLWPTERAARVMVRAIAKRRRTYVFTAHGRAAGLLARFVPGLVHRAATRAR
jgi:NAD(P)-dependent dehydrogenase (short-subunit alcohol dehydrogenase family)